MMSRVPVTISFRPFWIGLLSTNGINQMTRIRLGNILFGTKFAEFVVKILQNNYLGPDIFNLFHKRFQTFWPGWPLRTAQIRRVLK